MDPQSTGSMLIMTGVALVVFAGFRLRAPRPSAAQNQDDKALETQKEETLETPETAPAPKNRKPSGPAGWVWLGRFGSFLALVGGMILILDYYRHGPR